MSFDPRGVRPKRGWITVLDDQRNDKTFSGILLPTNLTGIERVREGTGEVIAVGNGEKNEALGVKPGQKICYRSFLKYAHRLETEETWGSGEVKHFFLMDSDDILGIVPEGVTVGVFSGRPMVPTEKDSDAS